MIRTHAQRRFFHSLTRTSSEAPFLSLTNPRNYPLESLALLSSCKDLNSLLQIHAHFIISGFNPNNSTYTHLINLYSSFKKPDYARSVFNSTPNPAVILWNSMIRAYIRSNQQEEALKIYGYMLEKQLQPDKYTFTFLLKACAELLDLEEGVSIHREIVDKGLECDVFIGTGLVDMYCKTGDLESARRVFDKMSNKDIVAYNAMLSGLSQSSNPKEAVGFFRQMQVGGGGMEPNSVSLLNLLPAISKLMDIKSCKSIHGYVVRRVFPTAVLNGLIDLYSKCGYADIARVIFRQMWGRDEVSWGTMMAGYAHNGSFCEVLELFDQMRLENLKMNKVSAVSALLAAAEMRNLEKGMEIHDCVMQQRLDSDIVVATPIMTMYAKCGEFEMAKELLRRLEGRDLIAWSAIIAAFAQSGCAEEALSLFREMHNENWKPNRVTLVSVLPACAELLSLKLGKSLHCYAIRVGIDSDSLTGTALVSMYAKSDHLTSAVIIFNRLPHKEVVTWNALINGYAQIGDPYHAMEMYHQLQLSEILPDAGTMVGVVPACTLLGDLDRGACIHGQTIKGGFESDCHVNNALIDMYAKCGSLWSAEFLFRKAEFLKDEISWNTMIARLEGVCAGLST
ncbi:unnamed protein product [Ilex paraguariensis]|uniref:Pentatricopeptide repeat-containing protein n=1 Tax=Ilex paraguariensis TaxID=185542 RepID=A0ABC8U402_9AQUA